MGVSVARTKEISASKYARDAPDGLLRISSKRVVINESVQIQVAPNRKAPFFIQYSITPRNSLGKAYEDSSQNGSLEFRSSKTTKLFYFSGLPGPLTIVWSAKQLQFPVGSNTYKVT